MKHPVLTFANKESGSVDLDDAVFGIKTIRRDILARVINWQLAKRRAGTHKTRGVSEISGTTKKPFRQKGTGNARQGSLRSPQHRGGAVIFGPVVRSHGYSLNKKIRAMGLRMALSNKAQEKNLIVLDTLPANLQKTKEAIKGLDALAAKHAVIVAPAAELESVAKSFRNIPNIDVLPVEGANVYSIMKRRKLILTKQAAVTLQERLAA